jgi:iron complex transport system ATP-binding protein
MMAVMAQSEHIEPLLSVEEYISLGRIPHKRQLGGSENILEIERAIKLCGLDKLKRQSIQTLSGGERQRASLARAIAQSPDLLFLDEPTNHLDLRAKVDILDLIRKLPTTVLAVIHDLALVEDFADRVIVLQNGKIIADGPPAVSLSKKIVWDVFEMNRVDVSHPISGKQLKVFEASEHQINL